MTQPESHHDMHHNAAAVLGSLLQKHRCNKGLSVGAVAEQMKLPARQIEALEKGNYQGLPEAVFVRGFLRGYSTLVGLEAQVLEQHLSQIFSHVAGAAPQVAQSAKHSAPPIAAGFRFPKWLLVTLIFLMVLLIIYVWQSKSAEFGRFGADNTTTISGASIPEVGSKNVSVLPMTEAAGLTSNAANAAVNTENDVVQVATHVKASSAASGADKNTVQLAHDTLATDTLNIHVRHRSYLHVLDNKGDVLIASLVPAGTDHSFSGGAPYQVRIGYALGSRVEFNGKALDITRYIDNKTATFSVGQAHD